MDDPKVVHSNYVPAQLHRHLEFMQFNKDGHLIMGCSDLTGRNWSGSLWYYRDPVEPPNVEKALTGIELDQSVVDGRLVANNRMVVGLDNGGVEQVTLTFSDESDVQAPSFFFLERQYSVQEHDDLISGLDLTKDPLEGGGADGGQLVTVSYHRSIVALDINTMRLESRISDAHPNLISAVAAKRFHRGEAAKTIATAAQDGTVQLWDLRTSGKQNRLYSNASDWPTALEWNPDFEHHLYVGTQTGKVHLMDSRNETAPLLSPQTPVQCRNRKRWREIFGSLRRFLRSCSVQPSLGYTSSSIIGPLVHGQQTHRLCPRHGVERKQVTHLRMGSQIFPP